MTLSRLYLTGVAGLPIYDFLLVSNIVTPCLSSSHCLAVIGLWLAEKFSYLNCMGSKSNAKLYYFEVRALFYNLYSTLHAKLMPDVMNNN